VAGELGPLEAEEAGDDGVLQQVAVLLRTRHVPDKQCVRSGSDRIRNHLRDPDPQLEFQIRKGSKINFRLNTEFLLCKSVNSC